jgi:hypothetical protein
LKTLPRQSEEAFEVLQGERISCRYAFHGNLVPTGSLVVALGLSLRKCCDEYKLPKTNRQAIGTHIETCGGNSCFQELYCGLFCLVLKLR